MSNHQIVIEVSHANENRTFALSAPQYGLLEENIRRMFSFPAEQKIKVQYQDDEKDWIRIASDLEFELAVQFTNPLRLRALLEPNPAPVVVLAKENNTETVPFPTTGYLYLDGNNMLFVVSSIRKLAIKRGDRRQAEAALETIVSGFVQKTTYDKCVLMFDSTKRSFENNKLKVCSARPQFSTSDDALVEIAKVNKGATFVTSDRELTNRLIAQGAVVFKPGHWFKFAASTLGKAEEVATDTWATEYVAKRGLSTAL
eukprot:TRINITY_DN602_c0_g1_i1.p1 TRINITY_DN602_c0_g1~~TRINITY_DN602_c0_g1_i1.p1  ORF type:complete len:257 (+),score=77.03 TRINITY_DN602_c0_g1_i1:97-867(+)